MSTVEIRAEVHHLVDKIDERLLEAVHALLETYVKEQEGQIVGYETDGSPVTAGAFLEQAELAIKEAKGGKGITVEELEKRSAEWLKRMG